ncbi:hypothetical protein VF21_10610 [Pseudogymnoascus sp. 05NY08]|nr:hypothetical protein VF21_10610 [Pseudogymnoascus sp. 05NY08]
MKLSSHILAAWAIATATALTPVQESKEEFLTANATDNATISVKCSEAFYNFRVSDTAKLDGSLVVPDLVKLDSLYLSGNWYPKQPVATNLTLSTIDFPDLVNLTGQINIRNADKVSTLKMPKLEVVGDSVSIDLSGGPAISLTFPSLSSIGAGLIVKGNIKG